MFEKHVVKVWCFASTGTDSFGGVDDTKECAGVMIEGKEFFLEIGNKTFRFELDQNGNPVLALVNGINMQVTILHGLPAIRLMQGS